ncbi:MAG: hypothetical protein EOO85_10155 [Pedobacter sp.]|nr:MAG: hypothetical protein EOO85_10155 [Pedobacter sp.]
MFNTQEKQAVFTLLLKLINLNERQTEIHNAKAYLNILSLTPLELIMAVTTPFPSALEIADNMMKPQQKELFRLIYEVLILNKITARQMNMVNTFLMNIKIEPTLDNLGDLFSLIVVHKLNQSLLGK